MACRCGDWIGALARQHAGRLAAVARREGMSTVDALDVVQEAFQKLLGRPELRDDPAQAYKTLAALVRNAARNLRRRHYKAKAHRDLDEVALSADAPGPADGLERAQNREQLAGCMAKLDDVHRHIVTLRVLEELSGAETAEQLGLTPNHIAVLLHRAKKELERCMLTGS